MDLFAVAPLAPFEGDGVLDDQDCSETSSVVADADRQLKRVLSIPLDASFCSFENSLTNLIGNFDEKIYHCFENFDVDPEDVQTLHVSGNVATLSEVKRWWAAATTEFVPTDSYPLQSLPSNVNLYDLDQFELADADGITEDGIINARLLQTTNAINYSNESLCSARGAVTTLSLSSTSGSRRSSSLDRVSPNTFVQTPAVEVLNTSEKLSSHCLKDPDSDRYILDSFRSRHPSLPSKRTQNWIDDLQNLKVSILKLYTQQLNNEIMQLSGCLVDSLAARDELLMLREASDDFIVLLNLVHARKTKASKAALLATTKNFIRSKTLFRVSSPWFTKRSYTSASSTLSLIESSDLRKPVTTKHASNESDTHIPMGSVQLDLKNNSAAYVVSLNLHSKLRRPRTQPIYAHETNHSDIKSVSNSINLINLKQLGQSKLSERVAVSSESIESIPVKQAKIRYEALVNLCNSTNWPNGKPQNSISLRLRLPYRINPSAGVSINDLRLLNQILYATVLENPKIEKLLESYMMNITNSRKITEWVKTVEPPRCYDSQKLSGISCQDQHRNNFILTSMPTQCV
ncbi:hypothetical protein EWB00_004815 [Schistosoma japonicum]|uniref:Uncharacterized protein n=1 Tax=Schistosoma japonicum TaxID=6182 RepID=A0A4Z2DUH2_SCHJA|nr:hypothetical protein EWB00_004815 [Schistosoma japonicum]